MNLKQLFGFCEHKWKIISERDHVVTYRNGCKGKEGTLFALQCEKCGDMKRKYIGVI